MQDRFNYLCEKILSSDFETTPFKHIYIENFLSDTDFNEIISSPEINIDPVASDEELFERLFENEYEIVPFAGCTVDKKGYLQWRSGKQKQSGYNSACNSLGMALRLERPKSHILRQIKEFLASDSFNKVIAEKFGHDLENKIIDNGIQKYLDGYEISPHPDIRKKAVTFMININPHHNAEKLDHHAHLLKFTPDRDYIRVFWEGNGNIDRCLIPWDWSAIEKTQNKNNSLVIFSPSNDTLHAVVANYDHLLAQRTQLYGNIWFEDDQADCKLGWEELDILNTNTQRSKNAFSIFYERMIYQFHKISNITKAKEIGVNMSRTKNFKN